MEEEKEILNDNTHSMIMESMKEYPPLLKVDDIRKILQLGKNNTYALINSGSFKIIKIGKHIRVAKIELINHLVRMNK